MEIVMPTRKPDEPPVECAHGGTHRHGTLTMVQKDKCKCGPCRAAKRRSDARLRRNKAYGRSDLVDATEARNHLMLLDALGIKSTRVERVTGLDQHTLHRILGRSWEGGTTERVRKSTHEKIMALSLDPADWDDLRIGIDSTGTLRRMQALCAIGYSLGRQEDICNAGKRTFSRMMREDQKRVSKDIAQRVSDMYEKYWDRPFEPVGHRENQSTARALNTAKRNGWAPPMAWDDDTIDDPNALPMGIPEQEERKSCMDAEAVLEDVAWLMRAGVHPTEIAKRLGHTQRRIEQAARRRGLAEIARWMGASSRKNGEDVA